MPKSVILRQHCATDSAIRHSVKTMTNISNFLADWHLEGLAVGLATFLIIGLFHPVVIKCEYYFGVRCWWWFLVLGIAMCVVSMLIDNTIGSTLAGVVAFSSFWTIKEVFEQQERVRKGWFPANPRRKTAPRK